MRTPSALLGLLLTFTTANFASAGILSDSKPDQKVLAEQVLAKQNGTYEEELQPLLNVLEAEVRSELVQEAEQEHGPAKVRASGGFEAHLKEDKQLKIMISQLQSPKINKMDRADLLITYVKASIRYQYLASVRFQEAKAGGQTYKLNETKFRSLMKRLHDLLGIPL